MPGVRQLPFRNRRQMPSFNRETRNPKGGSTMYRTITIAALAFALSATASGQSKGRRPTPSKSEKELIAMSRTFVDTEIGKDIVVVTDGVTLTPSGLMGVAEVK